MELTNHSQSCPIPDVTVAFHRIEQCLSQLVDRERMYLSMRNNNELVKFKDAIYEKNLFKGISTCSLIDDQQVSQNNFKQNRLFLIK